jgi:aspartate aminotransferase
MTNEVELSPRVQRIKPSPTLAVSARADELIAAGKNITNLGAGEPDFDTPDFIKQAAMTAIQQGFTKYTAVDGTVGLKQAIIKKFARDNQLTYTLQQVIVSCGAKHSLYNLFSALLKAGDEVIIPSPYWVSYPDMAKLADATPVFIKTDINQKLKITPAQLEAAITPQTRLVILNSPSNPTGVAYTAEEFTALGQVLLRHPSIVVVSDDIYEHTLWDPASFSNIVMACPELYDRCVVVNGASKAYAMTGWRIGYAAGPAKIIAAMKKIQSQSTSNPTSIAQAAAEAALNGDQSCVTTMTHAYQKRHDFVVGELQKMPGVECQAGHGTFYTFPSMEGVIQRAANLNNDLELADYLLQKAEVAVVPGSAFGAPGHIRLSYATSMDNLQEAMKRIKAALNEV